MKLNFKFKDLRFGVLGLLAITALIYTSVIANAAHVDDTVISKPDGQRVRVFFFQNGNQVPTFWGNPVVPTSYDATGKHEKLINKAKVFALYNAMASRATTVDDKGVDEAPTLAFVIADHSFDGSQLASPLKEILSEKWKDTPIALALNRPVLNYVSQGAVEGTDCSVWVDGMQNDNAPSHYIMKSAVIIANSSMPMESILLCFRIKSALVFGLNTRLFDHQRNINSHIIDGWYYRTHPTFLELASLCREQEFDNAFGCITRSVFKKYSDLLNHLINDRLIPIDETMLSK